MRKLFCTIIVIPFILLSNAEAQTSGMDILNIGPNTHSFSVAQANTAYPVGPSSMFSNPANIMRVPSSALEASYSLWIKDTYLSQVSSVFQRDNHAFGLGVNSISVQDIEERSGSTTEPDGFFTSNQLSIAGSYAIRFKQVSLGVTGQFLSENYSIYSATGFAFNFGINTSFLNDRLNVAASLQNLGTMNELIEEPTPLPTNVRAGVHTQLIEFTAPGFSDVPIIVNLMGDLVKPLEDDIDSDSGVISQTDFYANIGTDINISDLINLRAGYQTGNTTRDLHFGIGIDVELIEFDYSVIPFETGFGTVHSLGIKYYFD